MTEVASRSREVNLAGLELKKPSTVLVDQLMGSYGRLDRFQVELAIHFHNLMTQHFGTENYDPEEALKLKFALPDPATICAPEPEDGPCVHPCEPSECEIEEREDGGDEPVEGVCGVRERDADQRETEVHGASEPE
jgi:hypothetical protein